jgi:hypothetical protein
MMNRIGPPRNGIQLYSINSAPLSGILEDTRFWIYGGDAFIGPFDLGVVDQPSVIHTRLACVYPDYMVDEKSGRWTPRDISSRIGFFEKTS